MKLHLILLLLVAIDKLFALQVNYSANQIYEYNYSSIVRTNAVNDDGVTRSTGFVFSCAARFYCRSAKQGLYVFEMTASDVVIENVQGKERTVIQRQNAELEAKFAKQVVFTSNRHGQVMDVISQQDEDDEILNIKTTIIGAFSTPEVNAQNANPVLEQIDSQGRHQTHYEVKRKDDIDIIQSSYTGKDFIQLRDENAKPEDVSVSGSQQQDLKSGVVISSHQESSVLFNGQQNDLIVDSVKGNIIIAANSSSEFNLLGVKLPKMAQNSEQELSLKEILKEYKSYKPVLYLQKKMYIDREKQQRKNAQKEGKIKTKNAVTNKIECPQGTDWCQGYDKTFTLGNTSCGAQVVTSVKVGANTGCKSSTRSFIAGAYVDLDLLILDRSIAAVKAVAEYGYVDGSSKTNGIDVSIFGHNVYKKNFPDLPCIGKEIKVAQIKKDFSAKYTVYVSVLPVTFQVGVSLGLDATAPYQLCVSDFQAKVGFFPKATIGLFADVSASVLLAKGGIRLKADFSETLDPKAYASGGNCSIGTSAFSHEDPLAAEFYGYVAVRDCSEGCAWGNNKQYTFWKWSLPHKDRNLWSFDWKI